MKNYKADPIKLHRKYKHIRIKLIPTDDAGHLSQNNLFYFQ